MIAAKFSLKTLSFAKNAAASFHLFCQRIIPNQFSRCQVEIENRNHHQTTDHLEMLLHNDEQMLKSNHNNNRIKIKTIVTNKINKKKTKNVEVVILMREMKQAVTTER